MSKKTTTTPAPTPEEKRIRRRRRIKRIIIALIVAVIAVRLLLELMLPLAIDRAARFYNMDCSYGRAKLGLTGGYAAIWDIKLTSRQDGKVVATSEFAEMALSVWDLMLGRLRIWRLGADGADISITRAADGSIPLLTQFVGAQTQAAPANVPAKELDLTPPLQVEAIRLSRLQIHVRDESVQPAFQKTLAANIRVSSLGDPKLPTKIDIQGWSDGLLEDLRITGSARSVGRTVDAELSLRARGARAAGVSGYLQAFGVVGQDEPIDCYANVRLSTTPVEGTLDALKGHVEITDARVLSARDVAARVKRVAVDASHFSPSKVAIKNLLVEDVEINATRNKQGKFGFAGLDYGAPPTTAPSTRPAVAASPATTAVAGAPLPEMSLDRMAISNVKLRFSDDAMGERSELALDVKQFQLSNLRSVATTQPSESQVILKGEMSAPGIASLIRLEGKSEPFAKTALSNLNVHVEGITLAAARPYLRALGLEPALKSASFDFGVTAEFQRTGKRDLVGSIRLTDLRLADSGDLLRVDAARIDGCHIDPVTLDVAIDAIDVQGPRLAAYRDARGRFGIFGLETVASTTQPRTAPAAIAPAAAPATLQSQSPSPATAIAMPIPSLKIGRFTWKGISLAVRDDLVKPANTLNMTDAGFEMKDFAVQFRPTTQPARPAQWKTWVRFPGVVDAVDVSGTLAATPSSIAVTADAKATGITASSLATYTSAAGLTPLLKSGAAQASLAADATVNGATTTANLRISNAQLADQGQSLAAMKKLEISQLATDGRETSLRKFEVDSPSITISRNADETFDVLGLRFVPSEQSSSPPGTPSLPDLPIIKLGEFQVSSAQLNWTDRTFAPAVQTQISTSATIAGLTTGEAAKPATLSAETSIKGAVARITSKGTLQLTPGAFSFTGDAQAQGITPSGLDAYMPGSVGFRNGTMSLLASGSVTNNPAGGIAARLDVTNMRVGESGQEDALSFPAARILVSRIDPAGLTIAADELSLSGLKLRSARQGDGAIFVGGLRLGGKDTRPILVTPSTKPTRPAQEKQVSELLAGARRALPEISFNHLLLAADEIRFTDEARPASKPLTVRNLTMRNTDRIAWLGKDAYAQPANHMEISMQLEPLADKVLVNVEMAPFASQPTLQWRLNVTGINGAKLGEIAPEIAGMVDGSTLKDGRFEMSGELAARIERRSPTEFDFVRGFNVDLNLRKIEFRNGDSPRVLGGLEEFRIINARIEPAANRLTIPTIEINKPIAYVTRDASGIHAMGLTVKPPTAPATPTAAAPSPTATPARPASPAAEESPGELTIRKVTFSGLDVVYEDKSFTPEVLVPLKDLDAEIQNISTSRSARPMRFSMLLSSGKAPMRKRGVSGEQAPMEQRELFALITANGQLSAYPRLNGWVKTSVNALDLTAFHGAAKQAGIGLYDGILDSQTDVRILNENDADVRSRAVLTDLSISEPADGPISRALKLPAPLDAVIKLMQDADGSITIPANVQLRGRTISMGEIISAGSSAAVHAIGSAIAAAPLKAAQGIGGLMGVGGEKQPREQVQAAVMFLPGDVSLQDVSLQPLESVVNALRDDKHARVVLRHALSPSDLSIAQVRANPNLRDTLDLVQATRERIATLTSERSQLAISLRASLAANPETTLYGGMSRLEALDTDLANTQKSLDEFGDLLRPGADRQADRRTRAACIDIGEARIKSVRQYLESLDLRDIASRIDVAPVTAKVAEGDTTGAVTLVVVKEQ